MLMPKSGRLVSTNGSMAQCIAHASEVAMPNPSQFSFNFMRTANIINLHYCCNF
jgi:hypothetical protein